MELTYEILNSLLDCKSILIVNIKRAVYAISHD
jgi:hypothetical protein